MKLGVNGWRLQGARTGVRRYLLNILTQWTPDVLSRFGFEQVNLYLPRELNRMDLPIPPCITVKVLPPQWRMLVWENLRFAPTASEHVLWCPSFSRPLFARGKIVVTSHEAIQQMYPHLFPRKARLFYNRLYGWSARHAALVISDSEASRQDVHRAWDVPLDRIHAIHLAPAECFHPVDTSESAPGIRKAHIGSDRPFFLFVGKMSGRRSMPPLFEAFGQLVKRTPLPHQVVIAGSNPHNLELDQMLARNGITGRISFSGDFKVSDEDLNILYNMADAMVMPSVYETVSLPVMEAQRAGTPVICIDTPAMRDITGDAAEFVPKLEAPLLFESLKRIGESPALRKDLSERGLINSQRFSWKKTANETLAVLQKAALLK